MYLRAERLHALSIGIFMILYFVVAPCADAQIPDNLRLVIEPGPETSRHEAVASQVKISKTTAAEICKIRSYCKLESGTLLSVVDKCMVENFSCGGDLSCKNSRTKLSRPGSYSDVFGNKIRLVVQGSRMQLVSEGADRKLGGINDDADIITDVNCD